MGGIEDYRATLIRILSEYAAFKPSFGEVEVERVFDVSNDHYEVSYAGWIGDQRIHGPVVHVDIRGEKLWIQHDGTEGGIANDLVEAGVPRDHIVLAFHPPHERQYSGFALG